MLKTVLLKKKDALKESFIWEMYSAAALLIWMDTWVRSWKISSTFGSAVFSASVKTELDLLSRWDRAEMNKMFHKGKIKVRSTMLLRCVQVELCFFTLTCSFLPSFPVFLHMISSPLLFQSSPVRSQWLFQAYSDYSCWYSDELFSETIKQTKPEASLRPLSA